MRALTWQGPRSVEIKEVPDPTLREPTDAIIRVTSTAICGSDLHLYEPLAPFMTPGDVMGHETMGVVEEVGSGVDSLAVGDRVVVPFNISCGTCWMCARGLFAQCETTQVRAHDKGAALFGYTSLYGQVPGGQAEYLRVPQAQFGPVKVPHEGPDERYLYLSDILPTAWQGVEFAGTADGQTLLVLGLGPVGQLACRIAARRGCRVIGVDRVAARLATASRHGAETIDASSTPDVAAAVAELTNGRGADASLDAVGMEAHGAGATKVVTSAVARAPKPVGRALSERFSMDSLTAFTTAVRATRRGGTVSVAGVYGGAMDPVPMLEIFDRGLTLRFGQCHVKRWTQELLDLITHEGDVFGLEDLATHRLPLGQAPEAYAMFAAKSDGCLKVVLQP